MQTMSPIKSLDKILNEAIELTHLELIDESSNHLIKGDESHIKVIAVSEAFDTLSLIERHRLINGCAEPLFNDGLHALAIHCYTPQEWETKKSAPASPLCNNH